MIFITSMCPVYSLAAPKKNVSIWYEMVGYELIYSVSGNVITISSYGNFF